LRYSTIKILWFHVNYRARKKNSTRKICIVQKLAEWLMHFPLNSRTGVIWAQFFCECWFCIVLQNQKAQFSRSIERKSSVQFSLAFRGATVKASALPRFFASPCIYFLLLINPKKSPFYNLTQNFKTKIAFNWVNKRAWPFVLTGWAWINGNFPSYKFLLSFYATRNDNGEVNEFSFMKC
jgi:hypothetical protein